MLSLDMCMICIACFAVVRTHTVVSHHCGIGEREREALGTSEEKLFLSLFPTGGLPVSYRLIAQNNNKHQACWSSASASLISCAVRFQMSIDLDWSLLDEELCARALEGINEALSTCKKPNFLGDIKATSFSLGRMGPQLEIVEIRDVFEEFLHVEHEDDEEEEQEELLDGEDEGDGYDDDAYTANFSSRHQPNNSMQHRPPASPTVSLGGMSSGIGRPLGTPGLYTPSAGLWMQNNPKMNGPLSASSSKTNATASGYPFPRFGHAHIHSNGHILRNNDDNASSAYTEDLKNRIHHRNIHVDQDPLAPIVPRPPPSQSPSVPPSGHHHQDHRRISTSTSSSPTSGINLQFHFKIKYQGNMSIALNTTLKVNYPSPSFMSLPLNLRISSLAFQGLLVVAYEGDKKRLHITLLDSDDDKSDPNRSKVVKGESLLKNAVVESEVGQSDKLVLKDVAKVEQFVLEMARKALQVRSRNSRRRYCPVLIGRSDFCYCPHSLIWLQDEIAWPNFQSFAWT